MPGMVHRTGVNAYAVHVRFTGVTTGATGAANTSAAVFGAASNKVINPTHVLTESDTWWLEPDAAGPNNVNASDTGSGADSASVAVAITAAADTGTGTDSAQAPAVQVSASDTGTFADAVLRVGITASDTGAGADSASAPTVAVTGTDTGAGADAVLRVGITGSDTGSGADTATVAVPVSAADTGTGVDSASLAAGLTGTDTGAGVDTATLAAAVSAADTRPGATDTATLATAISATDTGTGTDAVLRVGISATDTGAGVDNATVATQVTATDTGTGSDAVLRVGITAADTGSGADSAQYPAVQVTATDTGTGADSASVNAGGAVSATDTGTGTDTATLAAAVSATDTGSGANAATLAAALTAADIGRPANLLSAAAAEGSGGWSFANHSASGYSPAGGAITGTNSAWATGSGGGDGLRIYYPNLTAIPSRGHTASVKIRNDGPSSAFVTAYIEYFSPAYISSQPFGSGTINSGQTVTWSGSTAGNSRGIQASLLVIGPVDATLTLVVDDAYVTLGDYATVTATPPTATDTGSGANNATVAAAVTATDTASGTELVALVVQVTASDMGTFSDSASVVVGGGVDKAAADTGQFVDNAVITIVMVWAFTNPETKGGGRLDQTKPRSAPINRNLRKIRSPGGWYTILVFKDRIDPVTVAAKPRTDMLADADWYYEGPGPHYISDEERAILDGAGYGSSLVQVPAP